MPNVDTKIMQLNRQGLLWQAPVRFMHWLTAVSLLAATILTTHGDISHTVYGIIVLATLLIQLLGLRHQSSPSPALWLVTAVVVVLNLSGWFVPEGSFHLVSSMVAMLMAALYSATVLFESIQRMRMESV